ncbi:ATP-dependent DNA helicase PIF1-like [Glycine soja]|uniref:ATP-dependent DNA helicase PIF1-like n=1 Tax=Glycine soja TaxID=3848 RepID=UPI00103FCCEF|nr:ATP-dependent DNA helicase PIF1-like [Glycine soja]
MAHVVATFLFFYANTHEQRHIFDSIINAVNRGAGGMFFLYGYGGTGKTFMWKTLASTLRSKGDIMLTIASSWITSLLLPYDKTAHSKFSIPVPTLQNSMSNIHQGTEQAELLKATKLIIWDEAPMAHRYCFEALDKTLSDIMCMSNSDNVPFGGKVVVFGGDFRQILPDIPRGSRSDIVHATINASYLWDYCTVLKLTKNMCLQSNLTLTNSQEIKSFSQWLIDVGDGKLGKSDDGCYEIKIPPDLLITSFTDPIEAIVNHTYPDIQKKYKDEEFLKSRSILATKNEVVDQINDYVLNIIRGEEKGYFSYDSIDMTNAAATKAFEAITLEFLHSLKTS